MNIKNKNFIAYLMSMIESGNEKFNTAKHGMFGDTVGTTSNRKGNRSRFKRKPTHNSYMEPRAANPTRRATKLLNGPPGHLSHPRGAGITPFVTQDMLRAKEKQHNCRIVMVNGRMEDKYTGFPIPA